MLKFIDVAYHGVLLRMLETELEGAKVFEIVALSPSTLHMMISM